MKSEFSRLKVLLVLEFPIKFLFFPLSAVVTIQNTLQHMHRNRSKENKKYQPEIANPIKVL